MDNQIGIHIKAFDQTSKVLQDVQKRVQALGNSVASTTRGMGSNFASAGSQISSSFQRGLETARTATLAFGVAIAGIGAGAIKSAGDLEATAAGIRSIVGSAEKANKVLLVTQDIANNSSFEFDQLATTAKMLLAFGVSTEEVGGRLKVLGNISAALGTDINGLALAYGQVKANGKLAGEELNQFTERGVPLLDELSKMYGKTTAEMRKMIEQGRVGFPSVDQALRNLGEGSGKFATGMADQAQTMNGMFSTLKDTVKQFLGSIVGIDKVGNIVEGGLIDKIKKSLQSTLNYLNTNGPALQKKFADIFDGIGKTVGKMVNDIKPTIEGFLKGIKSFWDKNGKDIMKIAGDTWKFVMDIIKTVKEYISPLISDIVSQFDGKFGRIRDNTKSVFDGVKNAISSVLGIIVPLIRSVLKTITNFREKHGDDIMAAIKFAWNIVVAIIKAAAAGIGPIIDGLFKIFGGIIDFLKGVFTGDWDTAWKGIQEILDGVINILKGILNAFLSFFGTDISSGIKSAAEGVAGRFSWMADQIGGHMKRAMDFVNNAKNSIVKWMGEIGGATSKGVSDEGRGKSTDSSSGYGGSLMDNPWIAKGVASFQSAAKNTISKVSTSAKNAVASAKGFYDDMRILSMASARIEAKSGGGGGRAPALLAGGGGGGGGKGKTEAQKHAEELAKKAKEAAEKHIEKMRNSFNEALDKIKDRISKAKDELQGYKDKLTDLSKGWTEFAEEGRKALMDVGSELQGLYKKQDQLFKDQKNALNSDVASRYVEILGEIKDVQKSADEELKANGMSEQYIESMKQLKKLEDERLEAIKLVPKEILDQQVAYSEMSRTQQIVFDRNLEAQQQQKEMADEIMKTQEKASILQLQANAKLGGPANLKVEEKNGMREAFYQQADGTWKQIENLENAQLAASILEKQNEMRTEYALLQENIAQKTNLIQEFYAEAKGIHKSYEEYITAEMQKGYNEMFRSIQKIKPELISLIALRKEAGLATASSPSVAYSPQNDSAISVRGAGGNSSTSTQNYNVTVVIDGKSYENPTTREYFDQLLSAAGIDKKLADAKVNANLGIK